MLLWAVCRLLLLVYWQQAKAKIREMCVAYYCKDIGPFHSIPEEGFVELAQELINIGAAYGPVSAKDILPDPTSVSRRCYELATETCKQLIEQLN